MSRRDRYADDAEAIRFLVTRTGYIRRVLRSMGVDDVDLEDAQQEVFYRAIKASRDGRFRFWHPYSALAWLRVVATRVAIAQMTRRARIVFIVDEDALERPSGSVLVDMGREAQVQHALDLVAIFRATNPENWHAWALHAEGLTIQEIAKRTGVPAGTVATRIRLAKKSFASKIRWLRERERRWSR